MALQGKFFFIVALAFFVQKVRCDGDHTEGAHMFLTRSIDYGDEATDQIDSDDEGDADIPPPKASAHSPHSTQGTIYEDLHSPEAMQVLTEEYVGLIETEIAAETLDKLTEKMKSILTNKKSVGNFKQIRGEVYKYMTNPKTPKVIKDYLEERYKCYVNEKTPGLMKKKYDIIKSVVNDENIPKHIKFFQHEFVNFLTKSENVRKKIAEGFTIVSRLLSLPDISFQFTN